MAVNIFFALEKKLYSSGKKAVFYRLLITLLITIPVIALIIFSSLNTYNDITKEVYSSKQSEINLIETLIHERVYRLIAIAESLAAGPKLIENVKNGNWKEAVRYVEHTPEEFTYIESLFLVQTDGILKAGAGNYENIIDKNFAFRDWYKGVSANWQPYVSDIYTRQNNPQFNVIAIAVPIKELPVVGVIVEPDGNSGEDILGILVLQIRPEILADWLNEINIGENTVKYIVDKNGNLIAHTEIDTSKEFINFSNIPAVRKVISHEEGIGIFYYPVDKEDKLVVYTTCTEHDWGIILEETADSAFALRTRALLFQIPVYSLFLILSFTAVNLMLRYIASSRKSWEIDSRLAAIVENSDDAILSKDLNEVITSWNKGAEKVYGYSKEEIIGKPVSILIPEEIQSEMPEMMKQIKKGISVVHFTTQRIRKDGRRISISLTISPVRDIRGSITGSSIIARDVTAIKKLEKALGKSEILFRSAFENAPFGVYLADADSKFLRVNETFAKMVGYSKKELLHMTALDITYPGDIKKTRKNIDKMTGGPADDVRIEKRYVHKTGEIIWVRISTKIIRDDNKKFLYGIVNVEDITARKAADEKIVRLNKNLQNQAIMLNNSNAELEAFSYSVSHDLRAPLRGIDGFSNALVEDYFDKLDDQAKDYIDRIRKATQRMGNLIDDLLMLSRVTRNEMQFKVVNLSAVAEKISENLKKIAESDKRKVKFIIAPEIYAIGDENLLEILLTNLFDNAFKFSSRNPNVVIEFGVTFSGKQRIMYIKDNGVGFDMKYAGKLFSPFQRLHSVKEFQGTGIGLATAKRITGRHGGKIWVKSKPEEGTVFYFILPEIKKDKK